MSDEAAAEVKDLTKRYPKARVNAVDGVSFAAHPGEIFGLLGPNGAGKTTTVGVLTTRVLPTSGTAYLTGVDVVADPVRARTLLAVVPQRNNLDRSLSIRRNLLFHAAYHGVLANAARARAEELLDQFGLTDRADDKVEWMSGGQSQRVMIARALMHAPRVLFLDEPTTGLDPAARLFVWERVRELREQGVTIVLTTHDMDEAEALCDRVGIMDHGKLLALDTPAALTRTLPGSQTLDVTVELDGTDRQQLLDHVAGLHGVVRVEPITSQQGDFAMGPPGPMPGGAPPNAGFAPPGDGKADRTLRARLYVDGDAPALVGPVARLLAEDGTALSDIGIGRPSLEDVFIHFTGRTLR